MAETFLRKWFGSKPSLPVAEEARTEIDRELALRPNYRGPLSWLRAVVDELAPSREYIQATLPGPAAAREKLAAGKPLLHDLSVSIHGREFSRRWTRLCESLNQSQAGAISPELEKAVRRGLLGGQDVVAAILKHDPRPIGTISQKTRSDPELISTLVRFAVFPGLAIIQEESRSLCQGIAWDYGSCLVCGGSPLLGEFRGLDQSRFLRCGCCAASWEVPRQWCPACGNRDHKTLGYLAKEGEESRYRVATCEVCRSGIKMLSTLSALPPLMLLVADAVTLHLDLAAANQGFLFTPASTFGGPGRP